MIFKILTPLDWKLLLDFLTWLTPEALELWYFYGKSFDKKKVETILGDFDSIKVGLINTDGERIVTFGHLYNFTKDSCRLGIVSAIVGKGYGSRMMYELTLIARNIGMKRIYLSTYQDNHPALALYRRFGYRIIKEFTDRPRKRYELVCEI